MMQCWPSGMPQTQHLLDVAWQARQEDAAACARRFARMQANLASCDPLVRRWYEVAATPAAARIPLPLDIPGLAHRLEQARVPPSPDFVDEDQGFDLLAWNGQEGPCHASLILQAGSNRSGDDWMNDMSNSVGIAFEPLEPANADLLTVATLKPILLALIDAWEPATGNIRPLDLLDHWLGEPPNIDQFRIHGGWMTYLAPSWRHQVEPPPGAIVEETPDGGLLMIATEETFDLRDRAHVAAAYAIHQSLAPFWRSMPGA